MQDDVRDATRMLRSQPGFAAAALLMLALGIGATTAIFTVVNAVLINPLPYPDSDALVSIVHTVDGRDAGLRDAGPELGVLIAEDVRTHAA